MNYEYLWTNSTVGDLLGKVWRCFHLTLFRANSVSQVSILTKIGKSLVNLDTLVGTGTFAIECIRIRIRTRRKLFMRENLRLVKITRCVIFGLPIFKGRINRYEARHEFLIPLQQWPAAISSDILLRIRIRTSD